MRGALADCNTAIDIDATEALSWADRGNCRIWLGDYPKALQDLSKAMEVNRYLTDSYDRSWLARRMQGDLDAAIADIGKAIEIRPKEASFYSHRGFTRLEKGDLDGAAADCDQCVNLNPNDPYAYFNRACVLFQQGQGDQAQNDFARLTALWPDWAPRITAEKEYLKSPADASAQGDQLARRAASRLRRGDNFGAVIDLQRLLTETPGNVPALLQRAAAWKEIDLLGWALADLSKANSFVAVNSRKCRSANVLCRSFVTGQVTGRGTSLAPGGLEAVEAAAKAVLWEGRAEPVPVLHRLPCARAVRAAATLRLVLRSRQRHPDPRPE